MDRSKPGNRCLLQSTHGDLIDTIMLLRSSTIRGIDSKGRSHYNLAMNLVGLGAVTGEAYDARPAIQAFDGSMQKGEP